jgi:hypothetical protein
MPRHWLARKQTFVSGSFAVSQRQLSGDHNAAHWERGRIANRLLLAFQTGARSGATGEPMRNVVNNLNISDMIDVAAYAGSVPP